MLISFSVENWMSFRDRVTISMVPNRERRDLESIPYIGGYKKKILPVAAIYGGNASGKTNLFKAISFAKGLIVFGTHPDELLSVNPFRLDYSHPTSPTRFIFELLIDEIFYEFSFSANRTAIIEEKLLRITKDFYERELYSRDSNGFRFDQSLDQDKSLLEFVSKNTRNNQLFLTNSVSQNIGKFKSIHDWFRDSLTLVEPDSLSSSGFYPFEFLSDEKKHIYDEINENLPFLNTGISSLKKAEVDIPIPPQKIMSMLKQSPKKPREGESIRIRASDGRLFAVTLSGGELTAKRLFALHKREDGTEVEFDIHEESDGTLRIIHLLPIFLELVEPKSKKIFVIDEIERSLHPSMTYQLLSTYLNDCSKESRTQLLFMTHDSSLMDQKLLRRDEIWFAERDRFGASSLISLAEYLKTKHDNNLRRSYLEGRFSGVPRIIPEKFVKRYRSEPNM